MKVSRISLPIVTILLFQLIANEACSQTSSARWPAVTHETKPWSRWWWHGSAVTREGITAEMEAYKKAGLGGLEITPIYGVHGAEQQFVDYLSPQWVALLLYTLQEAERLDMGIDMATGTGWPFGGPWVTETDACKNLEYKTYNVRAGQRLTEKIEFIQEPFLRAVGNQVYEFYDSTMASERAREKSKELSMVEPRNIDVNQLVEPISANKNLQALALDQVKFKKALPLQTLMAYSESGKVLELTAEVDKDGYLQWTAPNESWKLFAVFAGWHGKMVERAGPGGEGNVIDHFSADALKNYLQYFDKAFQGHDLKSLRGFFNDSYEVDDARGAADWTPRLFDEFKKRRGYDLKEYLPALFGQADPNDNSSILSDYRETISELVLENFTQQWKRWAQGYNAVVRNQAHGSPANILDLYATVDIPEIEGVEPLRIKMASSAGNVTGKKLISSESATWLNEHFESNLADIKVAIDRFLVYGVNHIFYHGTAYSPPGEPWPGWLFYAAVHLNPRNSLWPHFSGLNKYVERAQSLLQQSTPDNEVLLYYPIYDRFATPGPEMIEHFDGVGAQFDNTAFKRSAEMMLAEGYAFDYVSDKQLLRTKVQGTNLVTEGNSTYKTLLLPKCKFIPLNTLEKIMSMAEEGATIIMVDGPPQHVSGYNNREANQKSLQEMLSKVKTTEDIHVTAYGKGKVIIGSDVSHLLKQAGITQETMLKQGLQVLRKKTSSNNPLYFVSNGETSFEGWVPLGRNGERVTLYNPMTGGFGVGKSRKSDGRMEVFLQLKPRETIFIEIRNSGKNAPQFTYGKPVGNPSLIDGNWALRFTEGGPTLPPPMTLKTLTSWAAASKEYSSFSGCGMYSITFQRPTAKAKQWMLDLGEIKESAEIFINGKSMGILVGPTFQLLVADDQLKKENLLEVKVCNGMANRIIDLDQHNVFWKKFYNINFPARKPENRKNNLFDASHLNPRDAGLLGPVKLWASD